MADSGKRSLILGHDEEKDSDVSLLFNKLCDGLVEEILVRLPTKSAVQFQVVCKKWYSLISSPCFISRFIHLRRGRDVQSSVLLQFITYEFDCNFMQLHYHFQIISDGSLLRDLYGERQFCLSYLPNKEVEMECSSADLILCSYLTPTTEETNYYLSNLLTRQWISLPTPPFDEDFMRSDSIGLLCSECKQVDNSYHPMFMIVRLSSHFSELPLSQFKVQLFSSQDRKWKTLVVSSPLPLKPHVSHITLVAYRGMLHWLNSESHCIAVYDPFNTPETFYRIIHLPTQLSFSLETNSCFGVSHGRLRVATIPNDEDEDPILNVWELEDYDSGLWNLVYKVHLQNLIHYPFFVRSFHPENGDGIYFGLKNGAVLLNMKSKIIEGIYPINKTVKFSSTKVYHLADQWWPTAVSSLQKHMTDYACLMKN